MAYNLLLKGHKCKVYYAHFPLPTSIQIIYIIISMKHLIVKICITAILLIACAPLSADDNAKVLGVNPQLIDQALKGKELIFERKYDEATRLFQTIENEYPTSPTGLAGQMAIWQVKMFECDDFRFKKQFEAAEKKYEKFATGELRKGDVPAWDYFVYGAADGMRGFFKTRQEQWWGALTNAMHAMRMLKQVKWMEPNFLDADLGFGAYTYWRSVVTKEIKILPFFTDRRNEGISLLKMAAERGKYIQDLANANLVFIYGNEDKYDQAIAIADRLLAKYPENIIMRYRKGLIYIWAKKYEQALKMFEEVYSMNPSIYKALMYQGVALTKMGKLVESKSALSKYIDIDKENEGRAIAHYWLGSIAETQKDIPLAIKHYEESLKLYKFKAAKIQLKKCKEAPLNTNL